MKILQRNLNRSTFVVWEIKRNVSVARFKFHCNILISGRIINGFGSEWDTLYICFPYFALKFTHNQDRKKKQSRLRWKWAI